MKGQTAVSGFLNLIIKVIGLIIVFVALIYFFTGFKFT